jgi:RNA:NAD 2'-phosphotransferase (TPT1/KptA family)
MMKRMLVFYVCKTNYKKRFNTEGLKICTTTFVMYDVRMHKTVLAKKKL